MQKEFKTQLEKMALFEQPLLPSASYLPLKNFRIKGVMRGGTGYYAFINNSYQTNGSKIILRNNEDSEIYLIIDDDPYTGGNIAIASITSATTVSLQEWLDHMNNDDIHVTLEDKIRWDEEAKELTIAVDDKMLVFTEILPDVEIEEEEEG